MFASPRIALWLFFLLGIAVARSADPALRVTVLNADEYVRSQAPMALRLRIDNPTPRLREGVLETTVSVDGTTDYIHETPLLSFAPGGNVRALTLPPTRQMRGGIVLRFRFIESGKPLDAGETRLPEPLTRQLLVLQTRGSVKENDATLVRFLRLERLLQNQGVSRFRTAYAAAEPAELPDTPLGYFAYDAVILSHRALSTAREKSLAALARWVDAGGSVLILPEPDQPLPDAAQKFLATLARDETGDVPASGNLFLRPGLGRAAVWRTPLPADGNPGAEWDAATLWIWKTTAALLTPRDRYYDPFGNDSLLGIRRQLTGMLTANARPIPMRTILGGFIIFVVVAAPLDYFVLGRRFRKYTWIVFPALCGVFAWGLMTYSDHRFARLQNTATCTVVDLGPDGRILRQTRYVARLSPTAGMGTHTADSALTVASPPPPGISSEEMHFPTPTYTGNTGGATTVRAAWKKWTPYFFRETSFPDGAEASAIDWDAKDPWKNGLPARGERETEGRFLFRGVLGGTQKFSADDITRGIDFAAHRPDFQPWLKQWADWNAATPTFRNSPNGNPVDFNDFALAACDEDTAILAAVITQGTDIRVYRKLYRKPSKP